MTLPSALSAHPLAALGTAAAVAPEPNDGEPQWQQFNAAIAQYSTQRHSMDWPLVRRLAEGLATARCDLKVYGYLGLSVVYTTANDESLYLPLAAVLHSLGALIEQGWSRCVPRADNRRQQQLKWFSEEVTPLVKERPPKPAQRGEFELCLQAAEYTAEQAGNALGLGYPLLRELREVLKEHERTLPAPPPPQVSAPPAAAVQIPPPPIAEKAAPATPKTESAPPVAVPPSVPVALSGEAAAPILSSVPSTASAAATPTSTAPPANPSELGRQALEDQLSALVIQLASDLRNDSLLDPAPYWLLRALRWANHDLLRAERVAEALAQKGRTQLPLPQGHARLGKDLEKRLAAGHHAAVVTECEELFATYPLWLDLQRYVAGALEGLGAQQAQAAVRAQCSLLLQCCPQVVELKFADREATPFADAETATWLRSQDAQPASAPQAPSSVAESLPDDLTAAVAVLQKRLTEATGGRQRFELHLRLAEHLLQNQRSDIAMPIVEELLAQVDSHRLNEWEPTLGRSALRLAVKSARAAELPSARRAQLWAQICKISPLDAVQLGPEIASLDS